MPVTSSDTFYDVPQSDATLYVYASAIDAYKTTEPWSLFGTILPIDEEAPYAVETLPAQGEGSAADAPIYDMVGRRLTEKPASRHRQGNTQRHFSCPHTCYSILFRIFAHRDTQTHMGIYTRKGDYGETSLVGGTRVSKCCTRLESYGTIDELSSHVGLLSSLISEDEPVCDILAAVQNDLFVCGAYLASEAGQCTCVSRDSVAAIEHEIDVMDMDLPKLHSFVLTGGCHTAAQAHVCRTVCRRAERAVLRLRDEGTVVDDTLLQYLNRLSDYFFILARTLNIKAGIEERTWQPAPGKTRT